MSTLAVLGATGHVGRIVLDVAAERGHGLVLVGRDAQRMRAAAAIVGDAVQDLRTFTGPTADAVAGTLGGVDGVVSAVGADPSVVAAIRGAAVQAGRPLVDTAATVTDVADTHARFDAAAREQGCAVVPGVGWRTLPGDLLAAVAASRVDRPRAVHVAYAVPVAGGLLRAASPGERREFAAQLGARGVAFEDGRRISELPGEARRLAWFPRPIGPHHAAGVPGLEPVTVPTHVAGVRTVRTYLALSSLRAEVFQGVGNLARWTWFAERAAARLTRSRPGPGPARRAATRWACVVEVAGEDGLARGWANGHDPHATTARSVVLVVEALVAGRGRPGVIAPSQADVPADLLDALAGASDARWSVGNVTGAS